MFCIHIVYRGIRILHELFVNASSISLCVWFFIHIGYQVSWFFVSCLYVILQRHFLCVFYSHWLQGYHNSPRIVSMWFFKFSLSVVMYSQWLQGYHDSLWVNTKMLKCPTTKLCIDLVDLVHAGHLSSNIVVQSSTLLLLFI